MIYFSIISITFFVIWLDNFINQLLFKLNYSVLKYFKSFPQQVQYNRYLGIFEEIDQSKNGIIEPDRLPRHMFAKSHFSRTSNSSQNLNETEENKVFDWVRQERLPLFFRTDSFREFKLCKMITRPLEELRPNSATSSQLIGGYSRQSRNFYFKNIQKRFILLVFLKLIAAISNTLSTNDHDDRNTGPQGFLFGSGFNLADSQDSFKNNMSRTFDNINDLDLPFLERFNKALFRRPGSRALSVPCYFPFASINFSTNTNLFKIENKINKNAESGKSRKSSSK